MTRYQLLVNEWENCTRCELSQNRERVVQVRGSIPCDVVFVGEAPGESENSIGQPFVGPAGYLLDQIIEQAQNPRPFTFGIMNLIGCIPREEDGSKVGQPPHDSIQACAPRLIELVSMCNPKLIVCVGKEAEEYLSTRYKFRVKVGDTIPRIAIMHPSAILRGNYANRPLAIKRQVLVIRDAVHTSFGVTNANDQATNG